ncbi:MAG TPA: hypothetical protein VLJ13_05585 [Brevundimonas sp.]|nr:hypothetical protein [Brevundimonas sp.]
MALGLLALAAAIWITVNIRNGNLTGTDDSVDIELIAPAGS